MQIIPALKTGEQAIEHIANQTDTILLAFSCGKDSVGAWLECRKYFRRIIPFYMYLVPGLKFVERSLAYYENWFGAPIMRVPHPSLYRMLNALVFQPPERAAGIRAHRLVNFDYTDVYKLIRAKHGLTDAAYCATGVRAVDSPYRMIALKRYGAVNVAKTSFWPIADWHKDRLLAEITQAGVQLAADYRVFGRSFDGIDYRFLEPIRRTWPDDYRRILEWFPLAGLELQRRQYAA